jgi:hypothetical protein
MEAGAILSSGLAARCREFDPLFGNSLLLEIDGADLSRVPLPLLDSHSPENPLGHVADAWVKNGLLLGTLVFDDTPAGRSAFEMVESKKLNGRRMGVSVGTFINFNDISVYDADGREIDIDEREFRRNPDPAWRLHARRWQLREVSMAERPKDEGAFVLGAWDLGKHFAHVPINNEVQQIRRRMEARQRSYSIRDDTDDGPLIEAAKKLGWMRRSIRDNADDGPLMRRVIVPDRGLVFYAPPERIV